MEYVLSDYACELDDIRYRVCYICTASEEKFILKFEFFGLDDESILTLYLQVLLVQKFWPNGEV